MSQNVSEDLLNNRGVFVSLDYQNQRNMVKHIILWTLKPELSEEEKEMVKAGIKQGLESLVGKVPGLIDVKVQTAGRLASSTADLMLDCTLEDEAALKGYAQHPEDSPASQASCRSQT